MTYSNNNLVRTQYQGENHTSRIAVYSPATLMQQQTVPSLDKY